MRNFLHMVGDSEEKTRTRGGGGKVEENAEAKEKDKLRQKETSKEDRIRKYGQQKKHSDFRGMGQIK